MATDQERKPTPELDIQKAIFESELFLGNEDRSMSATQQHRLGLQVIRHLTEHDPENDRPPIMRVIRKDGKTTVTLYPDATEGEYDQQNEG